MGALSGIRVVFTGRMSKTRQEMEDEAAALGASVHAKINVSTDWVVAGDRPGTVKLRDANKYACPVIGEAEYRERIARQSPATPPVPPAEPRREATTPRPTVRPPWLEHIQQKAAVKF